jgi:hypothetical protein
MMGWLRSYWTRWTTIGAIGIFAFLCLSFIGLVYALQPRHIALAEPTAILLVIPAPTATSTPISALPTPTATGVPESENGISKGMFVQITGTSGEGLRIRSGAGTDNPPKFLGMDAEVFKVMDGPKHADGMTWWFLVAPYDDSRSGWAAATYLSVVPNPQQ